MSAAPTEPVLLKIKKVPDEDPNAEGVWFDYKHTKATPTKGQLYKSPDWHWLDNLCGIGYHCVQYKLVGK